MKYIFESVDITVHRSREYKGDLVIKTKYDDSVVILNNQEQYEIYKILKEWCLKNDIPI